MIRLVNETAAAAARFINGTIIPIKFRWSNHEVRVREVTGRWERADGQYRIHNFAVLGEGDAYYEISLHTRDMQWYVDKMSIE